MVGDGLRFCESKPPKNNLRNTLLIQVNGHKQAVAVASSTRAQKFKSLS
jgi:hypothetical protein